MAVVMCGGNMYVVANKGVLDLCVTGGVVDSDGTVVVAAEIVATNERRLT
jgi:hypothetical protein